MAETEETSGATAEQPAPAAPVVAQAPHPQQSPPEAPAAPGDPRADAIREAILAPLRNGPIARNGECWNVLITAIPAIVAAVLREV